MAPCCSTAHTPNCLDPHTHHPYRYPTQLLTEQELEALTCNFRGNLRVKCAWFPYQLTHSFIHNIVHGARSHPAAAAQQGTAAGVVLGTAAEATCVGGETSGGAGVHGAYQRLCAVVFLQFFNHVLSAPEPEAWRLMSRCLVVWIRHTRFRGVMGLRLGLRV